MNKPISTNPKHPDTLKVSVYSIGKKPLSVAITDNATCKKITEIILNGIDNGKIRL